MSFVNECHLLELSPYPRCHKRQKQRFEGSKIGTKKSLFADWFPLIFGEVFKYRLWKYLREINPELRLNLARDKILS